MTISEQDEREARQWADDVLAHQNAYSDADISLARTILALLDAAERALALDSVGFTPSTPDIAAARDAALEEAAKVCDDAASTAPSTEYGGGFTDGVSWAAANIRSIKGAA